MEISIDIQKRNPIEIPSESHPNPIEIPSKSHRNPIRIPYRNPIQKYTWLVVWLPFFEFSQKYWVSTRPNWRFLIFFRGVFPQPATRYHIISYHPWRIRMYGIYANMTGVFLDGQWQTINIAYGSGSVMGCRHPIQVIIPSVDFLRSGALPEVGWDDTWVDDGGWICLWYMNDYMNGRTWWCYLEEILEILDILRGDVG